MKKVLMAFVVLAAAVAVPVGASAQGVPGMTIVTGTVKAGSARVANANVKAVCNGSALTDQTNGSGDYVIQFTDVQCPADANVTVTATKGGASGTKSGTADDVTTKLNIALVDVNVALPEMGTIVGGVAAIGGAGAFMAVRRKQLQGDRS